MLCVDKTTTPTANVSGSSERSVARKGSHTIRSVFVKPCLRDEDNIQVGENSTAF